MRSLLILFILCSFTAPHNFYVSMTEIEWDDTNQVLGVSSRFFIDDMERALSESSPFKISEPMEPRHLEQLENYFLNHLGIEDELGPLELEFLGFEIEKDLIYCYAESSRRADEKSARVKADWLTEVFFDQSNMIHYHTMQGIKTLLLNREHSSASVLE